MRLKHGVGICSVIILFLALLQHGLFNFSDHVEFAKLLQHTRKVSVSDEDSDSMEQPTRNPTLSLRHMVVRARREVHDATLWHRWHQNGWKLQPWQIQKVKLLVIGELVQKMRAANEAYGHGAGASNGITKQQADILAAYTSRCF